MFSPVQPDVVLGAGPRPFQSTDDVLAQLPALLRDTPVDPIRDALLASLTALLFACEQAGEYAAAQTDKVRATVQYLDGLGGDGGVFRAPSEDPESYRSRLLMVPSIVTEQAIVAAVNIILAPFTDVQCQALDAALDRWFVGDSGSRRWHSFLEASPSYPSRLYPSEATRDGGIVRPNSEPGGARVFGDAKGRMFFLRVPDLSLLSTNDSSVWKRTSYAASPGLSGFFVGSGAVVLGGAVLVQATFMSVGTVALAVYQAIESTVNDLVGQSVRWSMISEPGLT
jgi:hypothetical protein